MLNDACGGIRAVRSSVRATRIIMICGGGIVVARRGVDRRNWTCAAVIDVGWRKTDAGDRPKMHAEIVFADKLPIYLWTTRGDGGIEARDRHEPFATDQN